MNKPIKKIFLISTIAAVTPLTLLVTSCGNKVVTEWPEANPLEDFVYSSTNITGLNPNFRGKILAFPQSLGSNPLRNISLEASYIDSPAKQNIEEVWLPNKDAESDTCYLQENLFQNMPNLKKVVYGSATKGQFTQKTWSKPADGGTWTDEQFAGFATKGFDVYYNWYITEAEWSSTPFTYTGWAPYGEKLNNIYMLKTDDPDVITKKQYVSLANGREFQDQGFPNKGWTENKFHYVEFNI